MIAWMVAGQGAEHPGMGVELARAHALAARLFEHASEAAGKDLLQLSESGGRALLRTEYLQPALTAVALGAASFLRDEGIEPAWVLGHSAGEVGALALAGHISFEDACRLSARRGRAMSHAARARPGGMAAVWGSERELRDVVARGSIAGAIHAAGQITADTYLVTGEREALQAVTSCEGVWRLPVSGAWHSPLMREAADELCPLVKSMVNETAGTTEWVSNETAQPGPRNAVGAAELLLAQLTRPMKLHQSIQLLLERGITDVVVLGPHHALRQIIKRHLDAWPNVCVHSTSSVEELRAVVRELS